MCLCVQDGQQRTITEMFQRSFAEEDGWDEDLLLEAVEAVEPPPSLVEAPPSLEEAQSPSKRRCVQQCFR